jgi:hypothetical protein
LSVRSSLSLFVIAGLDPAIHDRERCSIDPVSLDRRVKPGDDIPVVQPNCRLV